MSLGDNDATARVEAVTLAKDLGFSPRNSSKVQWGARLLRLWDGERERKSARKFCRLGTSAIPPKKTKNPQKSATRSAGIHLEADGGFKQKSFLWTQKKTEIQKVWRCQRIRWIRDNQIEILPPSYIPTIFHISKTGLLLPERYRVRSKPCLGIPTGIF